MLTLNVLKNAVRKYEIGEECDESFVSNLVEVKFETEIKKLNLPYSCLPAITVDKQFDSEKTCYLVFTKNGEFLNVILTNVKPTKQKLTAPLLRLIDSNYKVDKADSLIKAAYDSF